MCWYQRDSVVGSSPTGGAKKKALASASAFFNEAHLRCMKNEAAFGYEAWLRHTESLKCASLRGATRRFIRARRVHHIGVSRCFINYKNCNFAL